MENLAKELKQLILDAKLEWEIKVYKELKPVGDEYRYIANYLVEHGVMIAKWNYCLITERGNVLWIKYI